ncbi:hypothetical protein BT63DRAFT_449032 [Microthyrium microscopicum]|uniref:F-box domain-containing protein n=1 Tax=Microthyrium microscopicum TaxID=703497 RepID=A0A6A6USV8_9PEZI|nr:hypothetical protein BT63DRAFT_449032 [Microthyrium microscopicum]
MDSLTRLYGLFSLYKERPEQQQIQQTSALLALPLELVLIVEGFLNDVDKIAFWTTCRQLYCHEETLQLRLVGENRTRWLKLIERDNRELFYCHTCMVLHPVYNVLPTIEPPHDDLAPCKRHESQEKRPKVSESTQGLTFMGLTFAASQYFQPQSWQNEKGPCCVCDQHETFVSSKYVLHFDVARLAMDRHLYGESRGIPLEDLEKRIQPFLFGNFYRCAMEIWEASIIDNHLFLSSKRWIDDGLKFKHVQGKDSVPNHEWNRYNVCTHLRYFFGFKIGAARPSLEQYLQCNGGTFMRSCRYCSTDYEFRQNTTTGSVILTTFHCLGTCRSPDDDLWRYARQKMESDDWEPTTTISFPSARKSWMAEALVYKALTVKKAPFVVVG